MSKTMTVDALCSKWVATIISENPEIMGHVAQQRAKFEGWLKMELVKHAERNGAKDITIEKSYPNVDKRRSDLYFVLKKKEYYIELKTSNTSRSVQGVESKIKPTTDNTNFIIADITKLGSLDKSKHREGIILFVMFPILSNDTEIINDCLVKINDKTGLKLTEKNNCKRVRVKLLKKGKCDFIVCSAFVQQLKPE
jgi:hypothetical protein